MPAAGVTAGSAAYALAAGLETPLRKRLTLGTPETILAVPAAAAKGSNPKKVLMLRCSVEAASGTPTLTLDILGSDGSTVYIIRAASALSAGEVYREVDIYLSAGETLRGTASAAVSVTGSFIDFPRGNATA